MATTNEIEVVSLQEVLKLLLSKYVSAPSLVLLPVSDILIGIIPQEISDESTVWNVCGFRNLLDLLKTVHIFREPTVHTHYFLVNQGDKRHVVKAAVESLPKRNFVSSFDFVEETVNSSDGLGLVISS